ncbi:MAG: hypothetical protein KGJ60_15320 [Verrucomicrobiota bacterium]|nr:hypothetical protein [Verrucomicrobiota bacterium]
MKKIRLAPALAGLFAVAAAHCGATTFTENFSTDPLQRGWGIFGDTNLFRWDATRHDLAVTWDSSQPNSYFYHPLGNILARDDDFSVAFDLQLSDVAVTNSFELAVGLLNYAEATNADFSRPMGSTPDLFEFDYFPDGGYGPSLDATLSDTNVSATNMNDFYFAYDNLPLANGVTYHVVLAHAAGEPTLSGAIYTNGQVYTSLPKMYAGPIADFRLDTLSVSSYSAAGDTYGDSILAHGTVGNFVVTLPPPPVQDLGGVLTNRLWQAQFLSRSNWLYTLQRTADFQSWTNVSAATAGTAANLVLQDASPPPGRAFYRVSAARP